MINELIKDIEATLIQKKPALSEEKINRMYKIINPDTPDYKILGVKTADIEKLIREILKKYNPLYEEAKIIFQKLCKTKVEENKFAAFFLMNRYKKEFNEEIPKFFKNAYFSNCQTWSSCDSCCIRVLGPFLAKDPSLARKTIDSWAQDKNVWLKRASMVLHLKIIMIHKNFDARYVFNKVEQMIPFSQENYIEKAIGWLLKTCSRYKPDVIITYLTNNKKNLSRTILRYASEKLSKEERASILKK